MPKGSEKLTNARRQEIIDACEQLYEVMPFKDITLGEIGAKTSFTRTSIYNYFRTKEEIFLALLEREFRTWSSDLASLAEQSFPQLEFASRFADLLAGRRCMLKLLSMNLYDLETGSRLENLVEFKKAYKDSMQAVALCLERHFPNVTEEEVQQFVYAFYPFLFGVYPYTEVTPKQTEAMRLAQVPYISHSVSTLTASLITKLTAGFGDAL